MQDKKTDKQSYKDLEIYKLAHSLAVQIHKITITDLPKFEMLEQGSQIRRSSKSVSAAIVEGFGRKQYPQEFRRFLTYALASCDETKEHLDLLFETQSFKKKEQYELLAAGYSRLGKMIYGFRSSVIRNGKS